MKLLALLLCRERCSAEWIRPLCYFLLNLSCVQDNRLSSLLIYSPNVSFSYNSRWPSFDQPSVSHWRCRRSTSPQYRTNRGTHVTSVTIFRRGIQKTQDFFVSLLLKKQNFHVNAAFREFKWLREKLVAYLKCQESFFEALVCRDRTKQTGIVMSLLTSTSRVLLDSVATSNKCLHGGCNYSAQLQHPWPHVCVGRAHGQQSGG